MLADDTPNGFSMGLLSPPASPLLCAPTFIYLQIEFGSVKIEDGYFQMQQVNNIEWHSVLPHSMEEKKNRFLGEGNNATVFKATLPPSFKSQEVAIKVFHKENSDALYLALCELFYQGALFTEAPLNVLEPFGLFLVYQNQYFVIKRSYEEVTSVFTPFSDIKYTQVALVMERGFFGSLFTISPKLISLDFITDLGIQLANLLIALNKKGLVHGDIKPHNLFFKICNDEENIQLKLGDFSSTFRLVASDSTHYPPTCGTQVYYAPDLLQSKGPSYESVMGCDIYSTGVTLWTMITGYLPFQGIYSSVQRLIAIKKGFFECGQNSWRVAPNDKNCILLPSGEIIPSEKSTMLIKFIELLLRKEAAQRPTPPEIQAFFNKF